MNDNRTDRYRTAVDNFGKVLSNLEESCQLPINHPRDLSGIIKDFEMTYELGWKVLKKFLEREGHAAHSARECFAKAYQLGFLAQEDVWLALLKDRNLTVHTYNEKFARELVDRIKTMYKSSFEDLAKLFSPT